MATYLQNRLPIKANVKTRYELWNNRKPDWYHVNILDSKAHVNTQKRIKPDNAVIDSIFLSYDHGRKSWRIYLENNIIIIVRTIKLNENSQSEKKENEENISNFQEKKPSEHIDRHDVLRKEDAEEEQQKEESEDEKFEPRHPRRQKRLAEGIPSDRLSFLGNLDGIAAPKSWKDDKEMNKLIIAY